MKKYDVVIIGSGISSIISGLILTKHRKSVCILEQHYTPGGYTHSFTKNGVMYDTGAHYIGALDKGRPFHTLLTYLDIPMDGLFFPLDRHGYDILEFPSFSVEYACDYEQTISNLSTIFRKESDAIRRYFDYVKKVALQFPTYEYDSSYDEASMQKIMNTSLQDVLDTFTRRPRLQSALAAYCTLHGVFPKDVPFGIHAVVTDSLMHSVHGLRNGGQAFVDALLVRFKNQGGELFMQEKVVDLDIENSLIKKVTTASGKHFIAEWIISGIHPKAIFSFVRKHLKKAFTNRLDNIQESASFLTIYGEFKDVKHFAPLKNYYYFQQESPDKLIEVGTASDTPSCIFLSHPNTLDRKTGQTIIIPAKMEWFKRWENLCSNERKNDGAYNSIKQTIAQKILKTLASRGVSIDSWKTLDISTPITNRDFNGSIDGSAYGIYHSIDNTGVRALGPRTHIRNLLITGQSTLFPGMLGAAISGLRSCGHLIGIRSLLEELKKIQHTNRKG
ncbi:MAG: NAD(P)/FAD-dependent oxidoreductase [Oligoflexia bacterium]|nr:NAD(P)/FAD-dependent oxidoreductase [Oligoflexia bacterium]